MINDKIKTKVVSMIYTDWNANCVKWIMMICTGRQKRKLNTVLIRRYVKNFKFILQNSQYFEV